jgi:PAS domain S-box-containing protein
MIFLDTRTLVLSTALAYLSLAAARLASRGAYRSVPGHSAWMLSDALIGVGAVFLALRGGPIPLSASLVGSYVFVIGGAELRYRGVRQFCGLAPPPLVSLLPYLIVLTTRLLPSPRMRAELFDLTMVYVGARTAWVLLQHRAVGLFSELRVLAVVAGLTAVGSLAQALILMAQPMVGNMFWADQWFLVAMACLSIVWSFLSLGLASDWIEARRVAALEAQRKSDERFRVLLEESPIPTAVLTAEGAFEQVNRKFVESTGFTLDDVPDEEHWWALACPDLDRRSEARSVWHDVVQLAEANAPERPHGEIVVDFRNASSRTLELHARRVDDRLLMMLVDVTELRGAVRAREKMVAEVSHDLKAPLAAITMVARVFAQTAPDANLASLANSIGRSASNMDRLIRHLLQAAILESGRLRLELVKTDVAELIKSVVEAVAPLATKRSIHIVCDVAPVSALCDGEGLTRVLTNLIENAIKYTEEGMITVRAEQTAGETLISVADTGHGIAPETLPHIFDRYFTTARGQQGIGLGLHISKEIVEAHGGRIWATSEPGKGSTFWFTLPHAPTPASPAISTPEE